MPRERALSAMTSGNADIVGEAAGRGTLAPGALADLAVLDRDYFTVAADEIPAVRSELTIVGGRIVHSTGTTAASTAASTTGSTTGSTTYPGTHP
jgi:predicted amidohydrolase YtcJ